MGWGGAHNVLQEAPPHPSVSSASGPYKQQRSEVQQREEGSESLSVCYLNVGENVWGEECVAELGNRSGLPNTHWPSTLRSGKYNKCTGPITHAVSDRIWKSSAIWREQKTDHNNSFPEWHVHLLFPSVLSALSWPLSLSDSLPLALKNSSYLFYLEGSLSTASAGREKQKNVKLQGHSEWLLIIITQSITKTLVVGT